MDQLVRYFYKPKRWAVKINRFVSVLYFGLIYSLGVVHSNDIQNVKIQDVR